MLSPKQLPAHYTCFLQILRILRTVSVHFWRNVYNTSHLTTTSTGPYNLQPVVHEHRHIRNQLPRCWSIFWPRLPAITTGYWFQHAFAQTAFLSQWQPLTHLDPPNYTLLMLGSELYPSALNNGGRGALLLILLLSSIICFRRLRASADCPASIQSLLFSSFQRNFTSYHVLYLVHDFQHISPSSWGTANCAFCS